MMGKSISHKTQLNMLILRKHIAIKLVQDDIDWLKERACKCLKDFSETKIHEEKVRLWCMFEWYNALYEENKKEFNK